MSYGPGFDGFAYCADVYCQDCGEALMTGTDTGDTDDFPQPIFFGESDRAQHCAECGEYLYGEDLEECAPEEG